MNATALAPVLSARAEVGRGHHQRPRHRERSLRASGGGSTAITLIWVTVSFSPRERRWVAEHLQLAVADRVLSARAEVGRWAICCSRSGTGSLRASGGGSVHRQDRARDGWFSPRERRWVVAARVELGRRRVLSARAEVGRHRSPWRWPAWRSLRASGGGSASASTPTACRPFSPRERRWVGFRSRPDHTVGVLSARAEVGRTVRAPRELKRGSLRASGGGSSSRTFFAWRLAFSPRERRWVVDEIGSARYRDVLSARAEVGRSTREASAWTGCSLRASGGGSSPFLSSQPSLSFSPRERRWVDLRALDGAAAHVLSARAEVGRSTREASAWTGCSLRASGGGSLAGGFGAEVFVFSPRERRWVARSYTAGPETGVLSARAEVGRRGRPCAGGARGSLRASGGGSFGFRPRLWCQ